MERIIEIKKNRYYKVVRNLREKTHTVEKEYRSSWIEDMALECRYALGRKTAPHHAAFEAGYGICVFTDLTPALRFLVNHGTILFKCDCGPEMELKPIVTRNYWGYFWSVLVGEHELRGETPESFIASLINTQVLPESSAFVEWVRPIAVSAKYDRNEEELHVDWNLL